MIILMAIEAFILKSRFFGLNCLEGGSVGQTFRAENKGAIMYLKFGKWCVYNCLV